MENLYTYLERSTEKHHKFYEIRLEHSTIITSYGRIGRIGRSTIQYFSTLPDAFQFLQKQVQQKLKRGYLPAQKGVTEPRTKKLHFQQLKLPFL